MGTLLKAYSSNTMPLLAYGPIKSTVEHNVYYPKGPSSHHVRALGHLWVPKTINEDYMDP